MVFAIFAAVWFFGAGATLDQTSPTVHNFVEKNIVGEKDTVKK